MDPVTREEHPDDKARITHEVAGDMAAIFGPGTRTTVGEPLPGNSAGTRSRRPRRLIVAAIGSALTVTVAGAMMVSIDGATLPAATTTPAAKPVMRPAESREVSAPVLRSSSAPKIAFSDAATSTHTSDQALRRPVIAAVDRRVLPKPALSRRTVCDETDDACLASRIEQAEQRLSAAYAQAEAAGVRRRFLRSYLRDWDRARDEAVDQPQDALQLYAVITADLYNLVADEADIEDYRR
jgi:hypothetical protein